MFETNSLSEEMSKIIHDVSFKRSEIINEFCKAYVAHLSAKIPVEDIFNKIELVEHRGKNEIRWYFREKE